MTFAPFLTKAIAPQLLHFPSSDRHPNFNEVRSLQAEFRNILAPIGKLSTTPLPTTQTV
ncbi:MAG: hypothetical protein ACFE0J_03535 [Elainellaceae cyanobacterium]